MEKTQRVGTISSRGGRLEEKPQYRMFLHRRLQKDVNEVSIPSKTPMKKNYNASFQSTWRFYAIDVQIMHQNSLNDKETIVTSAGVLKRHKISVKTGTPLSTKTTSSSTCARVADMTPQRVHPRRPHYLYNTLLTTKRWLSSSPQQAQPDQKSQTKPKSDLHRHPKPPTQRSTQPNHQKMKLLNILALGALTTTSVSAVALFDVPACARSCALALPASCNNNPACICGDKAWLSTVSCCVEKACTPAGFKTTFQFAQEVCGYVGVNIGKPSCNAGGNGGKGADADAGNGTKGN
ncbi:hypothetical protein ACLMJK_007629 [Lecanora helva]